MVKVLRWGPIEDSYDPVTNKPIRGRVVTFMQEGRPTLNATLQASSDALSRKLGGNFGLPGRRIHTQLIPLDQLEKVPVDAELQGLHINRVLTSRPQMRQQENVPGRMVNNKLTYVTTVIEEQERDDRDERLDNKEVIALNPLLLLQAVTGTARVNRIQNENVFADDVVEAPEEILTEPQVQNQEGNNPK